MKRIDGGGPLSALALVSALMALLPAAAGGQELPETPDVNPTPGAEVVTLEQALERAAVRSPALAQARQQVENAETSVRTSYGAFLPNLSASLGSSLRSAQRFDSNTDRIVQGSSDSYNAGLSASYTVFSGGQRFAELDRARADVEAAEARRSDQRFQVNLRTRTLFFEALRQGDLLDVAESRVAQASESLEMTRRQARVGLATTSDTLRARLELVNARQNLLQAETASRAARFALGRQIGEAEPVIPAVPADLDPEPLGVDAEALLAEAEEGSPSVLAARAAAGAASAAVSSARTAYLPTLRLSSGYNWANEAASFQDGNTSWNLGVSASYPIFNGFQRETQVARAEVAMDVARLQEEDARLAARQEADAALHTLETAERAIDIAREALDVAREDLRVVRERYRVGVATILDVVTSQIALDQARVDLVQARYDYVLARAELEAILGREL